MFRIFCGSLMPNAAMLRILRTCGCTPSGHNRLYYKQPEAIYGGFVVIRLQKVCKISSSWESYYKRKEVGSVLEFEQIYRAYFRPVYHYIRQLSGDAHIAEDITSETFFKAMQSIGDFHGECDMQVWLCQIAKNAYYSFLKRNSRSTSVDISALHSVTDPKAQTEKQVGIQEDARQIRFALHSIPEPYKEVFMWRVFGELSFKEIGSLYGKTDNWACVTYHRAKKMIQNRLEETGNAP